MNAHRGDILMLLDRFPHPSQTFIVNELRELIRQGADVRLLAVFGINRGLFRRLSQARLVSGHVIAGNLSPRRRYRPLTQLVARLRTWRREGEVKVDVSPRDYKELLTASALTRVGGFRVVHYQFAGIARRCARMGVRHPEAERVFVSVRGKDITTTPLEKLAGKLSPLAEAGVHFLPVCRSFADRLEQHGGIPRSRITVHYSGIDSDYFTVDHAVQTARRARARAGAIHLYAAGRLTGKKGVVHVVDAFGQARRLLSPKEVDLTLTIAGDGPCADQVDARIAELELSSIVERRGTYAPADHRRELERAHLFVSHSVTASDGDQEGIPNTLKEAMAAELPVVATRHSGTPELVQEGVSGYLVDERDTAGMAEAICRLAEDTNLRERFGAEGARVVRERFDMSVTTAQLRKLYSL